IRALGLILCSVAGAIAPHLLLTSGLAGATALPGADGSTLDPMVRGTESPLGQVVAPPPTPLPAGVPAPPLPPLPAGVPAPRLPTPEGIVGLWPAADADIGIGHLRPRDLAFLNQPDWTSSPYLEANWLQDIALPIYAEPGGEAWGWLVNGWLVPVGGEPLAIGEDAAFLMLHTYYALFSFPVMEIREDGWFRFQYTPAGTAWAHRDHLEAGAVALTLETWEDRFLETGWVEFRNHGVSQPLRGNPNREDPIVTLVGPDSFIEPLAFDGDWMRVRVTQPTDGCTFLPGARSQEGWMRWRNQADGASLIWFPPKGC
ncbi:MAG: hypothetical protein VKJ09_07230, partial [Leptolyngbya sp.]|nr:hypothetical protein [Leptolyngbya sp.]